MDELELSHWLFGILGAVFIGLGKGGLPGMGNLTVAMYAIVLPNPKLSVGVLLPILCAADIVAVFIYRNDANIRDVARLLPWAILGIVLGYLFFQRLSSDDVCHFIGAMLLILTALHFIHQRLSAYRSDLQHSIWVRGFLGILGGFATMIANAAGPVAAFYFMSMRLPKVVFVGTTAWFFLVVNWIKVPFMIDLGIINTDWFFFSLYMMIPAALATCLAPHLLKRISQRHFTGLIWFFIVLAGIKLLFR